VRTSGRRDNLPVFPIEAGTKESWSVVVGSSFSLAHEFAVLRLSVAPRAGT
jgi:hypothetical protein